MFSCWKKTSCPCCLVVPGSAAAGAVTPSPCLTPCGDYGAVLSHSLSVLTVHICSPVCPTHQAPGSTTGVLFTEKPAWYTAKQMMKVQIFPHLQLWCCSPLCKQGGERSLKTPWHNTWKDKHRNLAARWKSLMGAPYISHHIHCGVTPL